MPGEAAVADLVKPARGRIGAAGDDRRGGVARMQHGDHGLGCGRHGHQPPPRQPQQRQPLAIPGAVDHAGPHDHAARGRQQRRDRILARPLAGGVAGQAGLPRRLRRDLHQAGLRCRAGDRGRQPGAAVAVDRQERGRVPRLHQTGQVHHRRGAVDQPGQRRGVAEVARHDLVSVRPASIRHRAPWLRPDQQPDPPARRVQRRRHVAPEEAGAAGDRRDRPRHVTPELGRRATRPGRTGAPPTG